MKNQDELLHKVLSGITKGELEKLLKIRKSMKPIPADGSGICGKHNPTMQFDV